MAGIQVPIPEAPHVGISRQRVTDIYIIVINPCDRVAIGKPAGIAEASRPDEALKNCAVVDSNGEVARIVVKSWKPIARSSWIGIGMNWRISTFSSTLPGVSLPSGGRIVEVQGNRVSSSSLECGAHSKVDG